MAGTEFGRVCSLTGEMRMFEAADDCAEVC